MPLHGSFNHVIANHSFDGIVMITAPLVERSNLLVNVDDINFLETQ